MQNDPKTTEIAEVMKENLRSLTLFWETVADEEDIELCEDGEIRDPEFLMRISGENVLKLIETRRMLQTAGEPRMPLDYVLSFVFGANGFEELECGCDDPPMASD